MASEDQPTFDSADAGAALVYPMQAGALRKGGHVMMKGKPCKISDIAISKTGKHGHAKASITGNDIFTGKKLEDMCPCSHNVEVPNVNRVEYTLLDADRDTGSVSVLTEGGDTKDDLNLPTEANGAREELGDQLCDALDEGKGLIVTVLMAMGQEKIISFKETA